MFKNQDSILLEERIGHNIDSSLLDRFEHPLRSELELELQLYKQSMRYNCGDRRGAAAREIQDLKTTID